MGALECDPAFWRFGDDGSVDATGTIPPSPVRQPAGLKDGQIMTVSTDRGSMSSVFSWLLARYSSGSEQWSAAGYGGSSGLTAITIGVCSLLSALASFGVIWQLRPLIPVGLLMLCCLGENRLLTRLTMAGLVRRRLS